MKSIQTWICRGGFADGIAPGLKRRQDNANDLVRAAIYDKPALALEYIKSHLLKLVQNPDRGQVTEIVGKVYLVGAGPGDPGLLTIKGKILLESADVVIYDALVSPEIIAIISPHAEKIDAGKRMGRHSLLQNETTELLIAKAREQAVVVRLKGGDPFIFGRGGEEMEDIIAAGIPVEVVPGVTSGIAAPAYAGIPLTHRNYSSSVIFVTGHEMAGKYRPGVNWSAIAHSAETIVVYMGVHNLDRITHELITAGLADDTPIALVRWGTTPAQQVLIATLTTVVDRVEVEKFSAPSIAVIGNVVRLHEILGSALA